MLCVIVVYIYVYFQYTKYLLKIAGVLMNWAGVWDPSFNETDSQETYLKNIDMHGNT